MAETSQTNRISLDFFFVLSACTLCIFLDSRLKSWGSEVTPSVTHSFDFWLGAKLSKASKDAYNRGGWLILWDLLNEWVAKGVAFDPHDFTLDAVQYIITLMCSFRFCAWLKCSSTHLSQWGQSYFWKYVARIRILLALFANWVTFFKTCKRQKDFCLLWIWLKQCSVTYQFEVSKKKNL